MLDNISQSARILGACYLHDPEEDEMTRMLDVFSQDGCLADWPFGAEEDLENVEELMREGSCVPLRDLHLEYTRLFLGPAAFEAPAWGSVYLDRSQVVFGTSTLELRSWMRANGIAITDGKNEPEDHIGKMLVLLAWLAGEKPELVDEFLGEHLMPWAPRFIDRLEADSRQPFYTALGRLTRITLQDIVDQRGVGVAKKRLYF